MQSNIDIARRFMETYVVGDADGFLACLTDDWQMHEADGEISTGADLAELTRLHKIGFPDKEVEYLHELAQGDVVAQSLLLTATHSGPYFDLEPTGKQIRFSEMIFHRMANGRVAESWRITHPGSFYEEITGRPRPPDNQT